MAEKPLSGITIVSFESRLADVSRQLIEKQGGSVISAPSMQEVPLDGTAEVAEFGRRLLDGKIDLLICLTGVGTRFLVQALEAQHDREEVLNRLRRVVVIARGPKPVKVLKELEIPIALKVPEPNTWMDLLAELDKHGDRYPVTGRTVAIQEYGQRNEELEAGLLDRGADVLRVPIYRWSLPDDLEPLKEGIRAIIEKGAHAAIFTSRNQIENVMQVAEGEGVAAEMTEALNGLVIASVGPICTEALKARGIRVDYEPEHPKLGALILGLARRRELFKTGSVHH